MFVFFMVLIAFPLIFMASAGLEKTLNFFIRFVAVLLIMSVCTAVGLLFDFMFGTDFRNYKAPTLYADAYANNLKNMGEALLIPFLVVIDLIKLAVHFTFVKASWITWVFQFWGVLIVLNFFGIAPNDAD
jgi:hypothetical protein